MILYNFYKIKNVYLFMKCIFYHYFIIHYKIYIIILNAISKCNALYKVITNETLFIHSQSLQ